MDYNEEEALQISGLQHFSFCKRQWALIHIEQLWKDNLRTVEGNILHEKAHDASQRERRGDVIVVRNLRVNAVSLGVTGACDVVEFRRDETGVPLPGQEGRYRPYPVEYKHGAPREDHANELQLCAQAMCLEEMLCCDVPEGALYFGQTRHRERVVFTQELRQEVRDALHQMHELYERHHTPKVKPSKACNACSLKEVCLPRMMQKRSVKSYLQEHLEA